MILARFHANRASPWDAVSLERLRSFQLFPTLVLILPFCPFCPAESGGL